MMAQRRVSLILNVDDDEAGRYAVTRALVHAGYVVREASTGHEAVELASSEPDVVLLDVNLPDMSGFDVCRRLRAATPTRSLRILMVSATALDAGSRARGLAAGADGYLVQPLESSALVAAIGELLAGGPDGAGPQPPRDDLEEPRASLLALLRLICAATNDRDVAALEALLHPRGAFDHMSGACSTRDQFLAALGRQDMLSFHVDDVTMIGIGVGIAHGSILQRAGRGHGQRAVHWLCVVRDGMLWRSRAFAVRRSAFAAGTRDGLVADFVAAAGLNAEEARALVESRLLPRGFAAPSG